MKDSRVSIWTSGTAHATGTTTNTGTGVDQAILGTSLATDREKFTGPAGLGVQILQTLVSGTAQVTSWTYDISDDNSAWVSGGFIGKALMDGVDPATKRINATIFPTRRYFRLVAANTGTGASTSKAFLEDTHGLLANTPSASDA